MWGKKEIEQKMITMFSYVLNKLYLSYCNKLITWNFQSAHHTHVLDKSRKRNFVTL